MDSAVIVGAARALIVEQVRLHPCHITGMHDPTHTTRYLCTDQQVDVLNQILQLLDLPIEEIRRELHPEPKDWCHYLPGDEGDRVRYRELHDWAGVPVPEKLAALGQVDGWTEPDGTAAEGEPCKAIDKAGRRCRDLKVGNHFHYAEVTR